MLSSLHQAEFSSRFSFIKQAAPEFVEQFYQKAQYRELPAGATICDEGQHCAHLAMILEGVGRVYKLSASGREITLYRINGGESCVLSASCLMNGDSFPAIAVTETPVRAILISPADVQNWLCQEQQWQHFVFSLLSHRLSSIISVVEEVAFKRLDVRLAEQFSRCLQTGETILHKTHADLAADVGSSREVVSRVLRDFSDRGLISAGRGHINILDGQALSHLAEQ